MLRNVRMNTLGTRDMQEFVMTERTIDDLCTWAEIASFLRMSKTKLYRIRTKKGAPKFPINQECVRGEVRAKPAAVEAWYRQVYREIK